MSQTFFGRSPDNKSVPFKNDIVENSVLRFKRKVMKVDPAKKVILAAFDIDGTLVQTKSGATFARGGHDWKILPFAKELKTRLTLLSQSHADHQCVCVLFTNQGGTVARRNSKSFSNLMTKITGILGALDCVDLVFASLKSEGMTRAKYRKPAAGMMELFTDAVECDIDHKLSFYVGDAAGRPQDHSRDDIDFAINAGLKFHTPEEYFGVVSEDK